MSAAAGREKPAGMIHISGDTITYEVRGRKYTRLEDVPEPFRTAWADKDGNGVPDSVDEHRAKMRQLNGMMPPGFGPLPFGHPPGMIRPFGPAPVSAPPLACDACGTGLGGVGRDGVCPSCGMPVRESIEAAAKRGREAAKAAAERHHQMRQEAMEAAARAEAAPARTAMLVGAGVVGGVALAAGVVAVLLAA